jgi:uncharacterized protein
VSAIDLLPVLCFFAALLYSSVGHAGASAYLASMALVGVAPETMKPTALVLNLFVASITTIQFARIGAVRWRTLLPLAAGSVPAAFLAAKLPVAPTAFQVLVALALLGAALRLLWQARLAARAEQNKPPHDATALLAGATIGAFAGVTGTGGGIFLTPLMLFLRWADARNASGVSAAFILLNSVAGIAGHTASLAHLPERMPLLIAAVVVGGAAGSTLGTRVFGHRALRLALAAVLFAAAAKLMIT